MTLKATDSGGNTSTCTATVTIRDLTPPTASCKTINVYLDDTGHAGITAAAVNNNSYDACGIATMTINNNQFTCADIASPKTVTLYLKDVNNNTSQCNSFVTIKDAIAPTAVVQRRHGDPERERQDHGLPQPAGARSTDNCSVTQYSPTAKVYTCANLGTNLLTITVKDYSNNSATCVSTITVLPPPGGCSSLVPGGPGSTMVKPTGFAPALTMTVYPNPTDRDVTVAFELPVDQVYHLRIFDLTGRMVLQMKGEGSTGENVLPIGLGDWPAGLYIVDLEAGVLNEQKRLVIQRN